MRRVTASLSILALACATSALAQPAQTPPPVPDHACGVNLDLTGGMHDILSNALVRGFRLPADQVTPFLDAARRTSATGPDLLAAAAAHFAIDHAPLRAEVERFKHVNCGLDIRYGDEPEPGSEEEIPATWGQFDAALQSSSAAWDFARNVTLHVVLHEMGHALIREFDIPILGNEETAADAFATCYLTAHMPDRALDVITARVTSLMIEAPDTPADDFSGEHDHDGRRAYQIAALAIAADPDKYASVAAIVGMTDDDIRRARDYGAEIHRGWRRVLGPLWMPAGETSSESRVRHVNDNPFMARLCNDGLAAEIAAQLARFDWHSQVTVAFEDSTGGAGWSRSSRTITVNSQYVSRFVTQGEQAAN